MINAISIDLEYWWNIEFLKGNIRSSLPDLMIESVEPLLELLDKYDTRATFFVLGMVDPYIMAQIDIEVVFDHFSVNLSHRFQLFYRQITCSYIFAPHLNLELVNKNVQEEQIQQHVLPFYLEDLLDLVVLISILN